MKEIECSDHAAIYFIIIIIIIIIIHGVKLLYLPADAVPFFQRLITLLELLSSPL